MNHTGAGSAEWYCAEHMTDRPRHDRNLLFFDGLDTAESIQALKDAVAGALNIATEPAPGVLLIDGSAGLATSMKRLRGCTLLAPNSGPRLGLLDGLTPAALVSAIQPPQSHGEDGRHLFCTATLLHALVETDKQVAQTCGAVREWRWTVADLLRLLAVVSAAQCSSYQGSELESLINHLLISANQSDPLGDSLAESVDYAARRVCTISRHAFSRIDSTVCSWLQPLTELPWAHVEGGFDLASVLSGGRVALSLSEEEHGAAALAAVRLIKARVFDALRGRQARSTDGQSPQVLIVIDDAHLTIGEDDLRFAPVARSLRCSLIYRTDQHRSLRLALGRPEGAIRAFLSEFPTQVACMPSTRTLRHLREQFDGGECMASARERLDGAVGRFVASFFRFIRKSPATTEVSS